MSLIGEILPLSHIVLDLEVSSKKRLFEEAAQLLENEAELPNTNVFDCLFAREKLGSTGLGQGVADSPRPSRMREKSYRCVYPHQRAGRL